MKTRFAERISVFLIFLLTFAGWAMAQEDTPPSGSQEGTSSSKAVSVDQEKQEQEAREKAKKEAEEKAERAKPLRDRMFSDVRNSAALSVGAMETYDSNIFDITEHPTSDSYTFIYPRFVANFERDHGGFSVDYMAGFRIYNRFTGLNKTEQLGTFMFRYELSPQTSVRVSDSVSYLPLNSISALQPPSFISDQPGVSSQIILANADNALRNSIAGEVTFKLNELTSLRFFESYDLVRYKTATSSNADGLTAGFGFVHHASRRLTVNTGYTFTDFIFNNQFASSKAHRLEAGFSYELRPTVILYASAGPELTVIPGLSHVNAFVRGGIQKNTRSSQFSVEYHQGASHDLSLASGLFSRSISATFTHRMREKLSLGLVAGYIQSHFLTSAQDHINGYQVGPRLEYAVRPDLMFIAAYYYANQRADEFELAPPTLRRHLVSVGIEYRLPRLFGRQ